MSTFTGFKIKYDSINDINLLKNLVITPSLTHPKLAEEDNTSFILLLQNCKHSSNKGSIWRNDADTKIGTTFPLSKIHLNIFYYNTIIIDFILYQCYNRAEYVLIVWL